VVTFPGLPRYRAPRPGHKQYPRLKPTADGIPPAFAPLLLALAIVVALPFSFQPKKPRAAAPAPSPPPPPVVQVETRIPAQGVDRQGRRLPFTVYVLSDQLSWKLESVTDLEGRQPLLNAELREAITRGQDVFCVGTASFEGNTLREEARAAERARTLARWVQAGIEVHVRVFQVNAGQYKGPPEGMGSPNQRKAIIIVTQGHADDVVLGDALRSGLESRQREYPIVASLLHDYSRSGEWLRVLNRQRPDAPDAAIASARR